MRFKPHERIFKNKCLETVFHVSGPNLRFPDVSSWLYKELLTQNPILQGGIAKPFRETRKHGFNKSNTFFCFCLSFLGFAYFYVVLAVLGQSLYSQIVPYSFLQFLASFCSFLQLCLQLCIALFIAFYRFLQLCLYCFLQS